jgi:hypothetical protein
VEAQKRYGFDIDENVIRVARLFNGRRCIFRVGSFETVGEVGEGSIDLLIMVNWLHDINCSEIRRGLETIMDKTRLRYLLLDEIKEKRGSYRHAHRFSVCLDELAKEVSRVDNGGEGTRDIVLMEVVA